MLREQNVRTGFFERGAVPVRSARTFRPRCSPWSRSPTCTGWRVPSEVLTLEWRQVDWQRWHRAARRRHATKNDSRARTFPYGDVLPDLARPAPGAARRNEGAGASKGVHRARGCSIATGNRSRTFRGAWDAACTAAGCPGAHPARLPTHGGAESGARRRAGTRRDAAHRAQDALGLRPLRHRQRAGSPRRREQTRGGRDKTGTVGERRRNSVEHDRCCKLLIIGAGGRNRTDTER